MVHETKKSNFYSCYCYNMKGMYSNDTPDWLRFVTSTIYDDEDCRTLYGTPGLRRTWNSVLRSKVSLKRVLEEVRDRGLRVPFVKVNETDDLLFRLI